jgi:hypothetical protein
MRRTRVHAKTPDDTKRLQPSGKTSSGYGNDEPHA